MGSGSLLLFSHPVVSCFLCPVDYSRPGLPVPHHLSEFAWVCVHCIGDAIQSSHSLTLSSALNLFQPQGLFQWVICSHQASDDQNTVASASAPVLLVIIQGWSPLRLTGLISCCPKDSQELSLAPQFEGINTLAFCFLYSPAPFILCGHWEDHNLNYP